MTRNIPDRIKLLLQLVVFSIALWLPLLLVLRLICSTLPINLQPNLVTQRWGAMITSIILQLVRVIYQWNNIIKHEHIGDVPDLDNQKNLDLFQSLLLLPGILLLVMGVTLFQLYSKTIGVLCFLGFAVLWFVDKLYFKRKSKVSLRGQR